MEQWITSASPPSNQWDVTRISVPHDTINCDMSKPPAGVGHTTEGGWTGSLGVFKEHWAPNFMVGKDDHGRVRIVQFVPIGMMAATLENAAGGVETNRWARAQFELVGYSSLDPWLPGDKVVDALAALLWTLEKEAGIPLSRPFPDALPAGVVWATESNPRRLSGKWGGTAGWFNHLEIPENDHWDMGAFRWRDVFARAGTPSKRLTGYHLSYTDKKGDRQTITTKTPTLWQSAHPRAKTRGRIIISRRFS